MMDRNKSVKQTLCAALDELLEKQFKRFKLGLRATEHDGKMKIPKSWLEKADQVDVVDLLCSSYGEDDALKVCICVLEEINARDVSAKLRERTQKDLGSLQVPEVSDYRNHIKTKFQTVRDPNSRVGEYVHLNQRYSKLIILDYHRPEKERGHEVMASGRKHGEIMEERARSSTTIEMLFKPDKHGLIPQVIVLLGAAGIGKTMTARKIMFDWASGQLYQDMFDYVFYIHCREMNLCMEERSIVELILKQWPSEYTVNNAAKELVKEILKNPKKILFIIDGFDELRFSMDQSENSLCTDPWKMVPLRILLRSLLWKKVLPESYLIITTRPTALEKLCECFECSRYAEILGFSIKDREEYFYNFFQNKDQAKQALRLVKRNETLFTMCLIPLVCWIICTVMEQQMENGEDLEQTSNTLTAVYMKYLYSLFKFHHSRSKQYSPRNLKGLCSLAADGIWKREILFWEEEIRKHGLDEEDALPLFLNENIFRRDIECVCAYSFIHLSFQEFFAALSYLLEGNVPASENSDQDVRTLLEGYLISRPDLEVTVRFLFGLLNEDKTTKVLKERFGWKISPEIKNILLGWVKNTLEEARKGNFHLKQAILQYLYETQDENFVKHALKNMTELGSYDLSEMSGMVLAYCLERCSSLEVLGFTGCSELHSETQYLENICKKMTSLRSQLKSLRLFKCDFTTACCEHLSSVLYTNQTLTELNLSFCTLRNSGVSLLCHGLRYPHIRLQCLDLSRCCFTEACCGDLAKVLSESQNLKTLHLSSNVIMDTGMKLLLKVLKHPDRKLEKLQLGSCYLTEASCKELAQLVSTNQNLKSLDLSSNDIKDNGMKLLCAGLKHQNCKLEKLWLGCCKLTGACCGKLAQVLSENQKLKMLNLFVNKLEDRGVMLLCNGLRHPDCQLETLQLYSCGLTRASCGSLAQVLSESQRLKELGLTLNDIDDTGMKLLCDGLKHEECKLEKLYVQGCIMTPAVWEDLSVTLAINPSLTELRINNIALGDSDRRRLRDALKLSGKQERKLLVDSICIRAKDDNGDEES